MNTKIRKVGNSYAVTVPKELADELALEEGAEVVIVREDDTLVIRPAESRWERFTNRARLRAEEAGITEADIEAAMREIRGR
ncbi:MAG: AbrB/MazE/SpoVT family DNA-binding domain-containing protein [Coriobacteriales bacterium]|nr:AbrB/MazE/SpoVT family DNA-binding domain-containing protein [Coriobacteriales bacterium]